MTTPATPGIHKAMYRTIAASPLPVSTPDLIAIHCFGKKNPRQHAWAALRRMERMGLIRRTKRSPSGTYWAKGVDEPVKSA